MSKFKEGDVVRFADGNGKMHLWGDNVEIDYMFVKGYAPEDEGRPTLSSHPYTFTGFADDVLVKVGEEYDTYYDESGDELYKWLPELNEPEEDPFEEREQ